MADFWESVRQAGGSALVSAVVLGLGAVAGYGAHFVLFAGLRRVARRTRTAFDDLLWRHARRPSRLLLPLLGVSLALPFAREGLAPAAAAWAGRLLAAWLIVAIGWLLAEAVLLTEKVVLGRFTMDAADNLRARKVTTQIRLLKRIAVFLIVLLTLAALLMTYEPVRELGAGLLASAGLAGLVLGFAAQRTLGNLLAGLQIALTQPIRLDDVVIVEGEWGWVEEITLTYVVIRIWDLRRLVVPISHFIEKPFQNWTRTSAEILGSVFVYVDYTVPVEEVRSRLHAVLEGSPLWDGRVWNLQVTSLGERAVELRALMSAASSGAAWDLRCEVREKLLDYLQREHPGSLPRVRLVSTVEGEDREVADAADPRPAEHP